MSAAISTFPPRDQLRSPRQEVTFISSSTVLYFTWHVTNIGVKDYKDEEQGQYLANYSVFPVYIDVDHFQLGAGNVKAPGSHIWVILIFKDIYSCQA